MSWAIGFDSDWNRDIGYGVPAMCDHPGCNKHINRGLGYVCGGSPYGGDHGCGLYFCGDHHFNANQQCARCVEESEPFKPKPDLNVWLEHKLIDPSWQAWRDENPEIVKVYTEIVYHQREPQE